MNRLRIRRHAAIALSLVAVFVLSACGSGLDAPTSQIYQASTGADHRGQVWVLNASMVTEQDGSATLSAALLNKKASDQQLTDVSIVDHDGDSLTVETTGLPQDLDVEQLQEVGVEDTPIIGVEDGVKPGFSVTITLSFTESADVTFKIPALKRSGRDVDVLDIDDAAEADEATDQDDDDSDAGAQDKDDEDNESGDTGNS